MPSTPPPHSEARSGLSLLDSSPLPEDTIQRSAAAVETSAVPDDPYETILKQAVSWKLELEAIRDEIYWLQVQNCQSLDALCMAGADIAN